MSWGEAAAIITFLIWSVAVAFIFRSKGYHEGYLQGVEELDPETGKLNSHALTEEIADVFAMAELTIQRFDLLRSLINIRQKRKMDMKRVWHRMLEESDAETTK